MQCRLLLIKVSVCQMHKGKCKLCSEADKWWLWWIMWTFCSLLSTLKSSAVEAKYTQPKCKPVNLQTKCHKYAIKTCAASKRSSTRLIRPCKASVLCSIPIIQVLQRSANDININTHILKNFGGKLFNCFLFYSGLYFIKLFILKKIYIFYLKFYDKLLFIFQMSRRWNAPHLSPHILGVLFSILATSQFPACVILFLVVLSVPVKVSSCLYQTCLTLSTSTLLCLSSVVIIIHCWNSLLLCCTWLDTPW